MRLILFQAVVSIPVDLWSLCKPKQADGIADDWKFAPASCTSTTITSDGAVEGLASADLPLL